MVFRNFALPRSKVSLRYWLSSVTVPWLGNNVRYSTVDHLTFQVTSSESTRGILSFAYNKIHKYV